MILRTDYRRFACPICGALPHIEASRDPDEPKPARFKAYCSGHSTHISCGDWQKTKLDAWKDWKKRRIDKNQPDFWYVTNYGATFGKKGLRQKVDVVGIADFLRRVQSGEFQLPEGMTWETWLDYPVDGEFPVGYPVE